MSEKQETIDLVKQIQAKKAREKELKIAAEKNKNEDKDIAFRISVNYPQYNVKQFLEQFDQIKDKVEEVVEDRIYIIKVKESEKKLVHEIEDIFEEYANKIECQIYSGLSMKERSFNYPSGFFSTNFNPNESREEIIKRSKETQEYKDEIRESHNIALTIDKTDLIERLADLVSDVYSVNKGVAKQFVNLINRESVKFFKQNKFIGMSDISTFELKGHLKTMGALKNGSYSVFSEISEESQKSRSRFYKKHDERHLLSILSKAKSESGFTDNVKMIDIDVYDDSGNDERSVEMDKKLQKRINEANIPELSGIVSTNSFEFFNYYNLTNYEELDNPGYEMVKEISNIFTKIEIAKYKESVFEKIDELIEKTKKGESLVESDANWVFEEEKKPTKKSKLKR